MLIIKHGQHHGIELETVYVDLKLVPKGQEEDVRAVEKNVMKLKLKK